MARKPEATPKAKRAPTEAEIAAVRAERKAKREAKAAAAKISGGLVPRGELQQAHQPAQGEVSSRLSHDRLDDDPGPALLEYAADRAEQETFER